MRTSKRTYEGGNMDKQILGGGVGEVVPGVSYRPAPIAYHTPSAALLLVGAAINSRLFMLADAIVESSKELQGELSAIVELNKCDYAGLSALSFAAMIERQHSKQA